MKIRHDFAEKKFVPGRGSGSGRVGVGSGWVFSKFKDQFKPINMDFSHYLVISGYGHIFI